VGLARFLEPASVMHNMTDEELLWWASMTPKVRSTPYHRAPKVAFLFLARGDLPLRPLWEKFFAGHEGLYSIYVHTDPSYTGSPPEDSVFYGRTIPSQVTIEQKEKKIYKMLLTVRISLVTVAQLFVIISISS
jgi:hypothetical protein